MIIKHNYTRFSDIKIGEVFDWDDLPMMRIVDFYDHNAVDLESGEVYCVANDACVTRLNTELIIN